MRKPIVNPKPKQVIKRKSIIERAFKKGYRRSKDRGLDMTKIESVMKMLVNGETLPKQYKDHNLKGEWIGYRECHIGPDWSLVYKKEDDAIIFADTGTHSELFKDK